MYAWLFAVDEHGRVGRRYIERHQRPFKPLHEDQSRVTGYLFRLDPGTGDVVPGKPFPVTEERLESWQDAGILVDPNG